MVDQYLDADAYLERISAERPEATTTSSLDSIIERHSRSIPFENVDQYLGIPVSIEINALEQKLVRKQRGGYCFEQNLLLAQALRQFNFVVTPLPARVLWGRPPDQDHLPGAGHVLLRVDDDEGPRLVDVGFGCIPIRTSIALLRGQVQDTSAGTFRLVGHARGAVLELRIRHTWRSLYLVEFSEAPMADLEVSHWYLTTHPTSRFRRGLMVARATEQGAITFDGTRVTTYNDNGPCDRGSIVDPHEIVALLVERFGLTFDAALRAALLRRLGAEKRG